MQPESRSAIKILGRSVLMRCPACGKASIVRRPFHVKHHCDNCRALFKREDGFFVGAILANVIVTEMVILVACVISLLVLAMEYDRVLVALLAVAVLFPLIFFHHSWSFWLGFDYFIEGLPKYRG